MNGDGQARASLKPRMFPVFVREVVRETTDTVTLVFDVPGELPPYRAGQFLTIDPRQFKVLAAQQVHIVDCSSFRSGGSVRTLPDLSQAR